MDFDHHSLPAPTILFAHTCLPVLIVLVGQRQPTRHLDLPSILVRPLTLTSPTFSVLDTPSSTSRSGNASSLSISARASAVNKCAYAELGKWPISRPKASLSMALRLGSSEGRSESSSRSGVHAAMSISAWICVVKMCAYASPG